ncbi:hypothetical protein HMPREF9318_00823 [Streptococcus urinalis FB127-CNA-2]|uniref:YtxH-like protein n=1 Tax=Streptococcus urinalis 2285-97 TaxID=764291 RepID=G5KHV7_9STRE|nr:YtxH domain-containing protein [Streptococcus urinalis]EHJ56581.1 hypothetical protein STRUR_1542 [Streptococcus urinalis 2285-97]EKS22625.1 hypothetical protein HMPREF9318_00823 [Streptococcus urinalis FB127-CNA-2]VEF32394.1 gas vesicle protein [Streptococcus urinalis]
MSKLLKSVIVGAASGAAAAYFMTTEKGQELQAKAKAAYEAYKENPEEYHQIAKVKTTEYKDLAVDTFKDYKSKFDNGELTKEDILNKVSQTADQVTRFATEKVNDVKEGLTKSSDDIEYHIKSEESDPKEDIIIEYPFEEKPEENADKEDSSNISHKN